jgi:hypothetical protein
MQPSSRYDAHPTNRVVGAAGVLFPCSEALLPRYRWRDSLFDSKFDMWAVTKPRRFPPPISVNLRAKWISLDDACFTPALAH